MRKKVIIVENKVITIINIKCTCYMYIKIFCIIKKICGKIIFKTFLQSWIKLNIL